VVSRFIGSVVLVAACVLWCAPVMALAQSMPDRVYLDLSADGHERLAKRIADRLKPTANPSRNDVEDVLKRWERASGGPASGRDWLAVSRLWLRADEASRARSALGQAAAGIPTGLYQLESARIGFLAGDSAAVDRYWESCSVADEEAAREVWLDIDMLATPEEVDAWSAFSRLPAGQRDDCSFFARFWARRAAASGMDVDDRIRVHYERLRYALDHYRRRGRAQEASSSGLLNGKLGRESRPVFDDRGLLYLRLGPPDETASFLGGECYQPNVSWNYRFPEGDRMYHLSPLSGVDNWWLIPNLAEVFRCQVGADGSIVQDRSPMVALPANLSEIPPVYLREIYLSRAGVDPEYARMAHRFNGLRTAEELQNERDLTWSAGLYAVTDVPERPDVAQDVHFSIEWIQFRLPRVEESRVWLLAAISGEDLEKVRESGSTDNFELIVSTLNKATGVHGRFSGQFSPPGRGSDLVARFPLSLPPGDYTTRVIVQAGATRSATDLEAESPSGGYLETALAVRDFGGSLPRLSDIAVSPDSGGAWSQVDQVALAPSPAHITNDDGRMWVYFEAYSLTPGGTYTAVVHMEPEDEGRSFDLEFSGVARSEGRVVTRSGLRLDLSDSPPGIYRLTLTLRDAATGRMALPAQTRIEIRPLATRATSVGVQP